MAKLHINTVKETNKYVTPITEVEENFGPHLNFLLADSYNYSADRLFVDYEAMNPIAGTMDGMFVHAVYVTDAEGYVIEFLTQFDWDMLSEGFEGEELEEYERLAEASELPSASKDDIRSSVAELTGGLITSYAYDVSLNQMDGFHRFVVDTAAVESYEAEKRAEYESTEIAEFEAAVALVARYQMNDDSLTDEELDNVDSAMATIELKELMVEFEKEVFAEGLTGDDAKKAAEERLIHDLLNF